MGHPKALVSKISFASLLIALGIVYGDIGTSPLYTFKAIIGGQKIDEVLVLGGVSCVIWTLTIQTTIKYVWLTLQADNEGEGGIFSLFSLVRRYSKYVIIPTMIGAAALMADGVITPAVTVTTSIEGLSMIKGLEHIEVIPIVLTIICALFFFQRFGTQKIGKFFGPIMFIWMMLLLIVGLFQLFTFPMVLKAFNPYYAYELLFQHPEGFWILGAVFLCTTGAEALYSDLGHCGKKNIHASWVFVKTCLIVNYLGQAAWLMRQQGELLGSRNPFFEMIPSWFLLTSIIIATLAAIVASQALISGTYTLINEATNLNFWYRLRIKQPTEVKGQVYIPTANNLLWICCIFVILHFQTSTNMEAAYGLTITIAMIMTTFLLSFFLLYKLKWKRIFVYAIIFLFSVIELSFFISNVMKFSHGGYITVFLGGAFFAVMYFSYYGKKTNDKYTQFIDLNRHNLEKLRALSEDESIPKFASHLVYLTKSANRHRIEGQIIQSIFSRTPKRADVYWLFHINRTNSPYTLNYEVSELIKDKFYKVNIDIGFRIRPKTEIYFNQIINDLMESGEISTTVAKSGATIYNHSIDFKFVVMEKFLSFENDFALKEGLMLKIYFLLQRIAQKDEDAFGLDKSDVQIEQFPLKYVPIGRQDLVRKKWDD